MEKLDIHNTDKLLKRKLEQLESSSMSEQQKKRMKQLVYELQIGKAARTKVKNHRIIAYIQFWLKLQDYFKKDLDKVTEKEAEKFVVDLEINKIKRENGLSYKDNTKNEFIKAYKRYLGWHCKNNKAVYDKKARWIKEYSQASEKRAITLEQAELVVNKELKTNKEYGLRNAALFLFLFDSGCRIEEALNIKINQIEKHTRKDADGFYYLIDIKVSKTLPRRISVPLCTTYLTEWLKEHPLGKPEDFLFPIGYDNARKIIKELSKKYLDLKITPHELRHSSATYYCKKIDNPYKFCYRYGWKFGSKEANRYIDRNLLGEEEQEKLANIIENDKLEMMEKEFAKFKMEINVQQGKLIELSSENEIIWGWLEKLASFSKVMLEATAENKITEKNLSKQLRELLPEGKLPRLLNK